MGNRTQSVISMWVLYKGGSWTSANRNASLGREEKKPIRLCKNSEALIDSHPYRAAILSLKRVSQPGYICIDRKDVHPIKAGLKIFYYSNASPFVVQKPIQGTVVSGVCQKQTLFPKGGFVVGPAVVGGGANIPGKAKPEENSADRAGTQMGIYKVLVPIRLGGKYYASGAYDCAPLIQLDLLK